MRWSGGSCNPYVEYLCDFNTLRRIERCLVGLTGVRAPRLGSLLRVLSFKSSVFLTDDDDTLALALSIGRNAASHMYVIIHLLRAS